MYRGLDGRKKMTEHSQHINMGLELLDEEKGKYWRLKGRCWRDVG